MNAATALGGRSTSLAEPHNLSEMTSELMCFLLMLSFQEMATHLFQTTWCNVGVYKVGNIIGQHSHLGDIVGSLFFPLD